MLQWCGDMGVAEWLAMVGIWAAVIAAAMWAVTRLFPAQRDADPVRTLDARLARGEIDADGYTRARAALTGTAGAPERDSTV